MIVQTLCNVRVKIYLRDMKDADVKVSTHTNYVWINICSSTHPAKLLLYALLRIGRSEFTNEEVLHWEERLWKNITEQEVELLLNKIWKDNPR